MFSKHRETRGRSIHLAYLPSDSELTGISFSVFRAVNIEDHRVAACKVIMLTEQSTEKDRKTIDKEMRVHAALKHENVLEFINAVVVELKHKQQYVPGIYMLLELAAGGDLFDKIGTLSSCFVEFHSLTYLYMKLRMWAWGTKSHTIISISSSQEW
jgi:serine/threonine protein kinase